MTEVTIDLADIGGRATRSTRAVGFTAPANRGSARIGDRLITTEPYWVDIVGGRGSVDIEPGPVEVTIHVGQKDGRAKVVTVPDQDDPVTLVELLDASYVYEPPVLSLVKQYRDQARTAAERAELAVEGVQDIADDVEKVALDRTAVEAARNAAAGSAAASDSRASDADQSAITATAAAQSASAATIDAESHAVAADQSATAATQSATDAANSATLAGQSDTRAADSATQAAGSATASTSARDQAQQFRNEAEEFKDQAGQAATGGIPDGSLGRVKLDDSVTDSLDLADAAVQGDDPRLSDERDPTEHRHTLNEVDGFFDAAADIEAQISRKADLDQSGKIPQAQMPAVALVDFLGPAASQAAMLALVGQRGDWCTRTDRGTDWQLIGEPSTSLANWREKTYPASPVSSVNGRVGTVTTSTDDLTDATTVGKNIIKAQNVGNVRDFIGAGTSNVAVGTGAANAMAGNRLQVVAALPGSPVAGVWYGIAE